MMSSESEIRLSEQQGDCLTFIEQVYMTEGSIPTAARIADVFGVSESLARKWLSSDAFQMLLSKKGIARRGTDGVLSPQQMMIANMLLNVSDRRSVREKCSEANVSLQKLEVWKRDPEFSSYMLKRAEELFNTSDAAAYMTIVRSIEAGDMKATQLYLEMKGRYRPASSRNDVNLEAFLSSFIEVLQARIKDSALLEQLALDLQNLLEGRPVVLNSMETARAALEPAPIEVDEIIPEVKARPASRTIEDVLSINLDMKG